MTKLTGDKSKCCNADTFIGGMGDFKDKGKASTRYYVCTVCNQPCDVVVDKKPKDSFKSKEELYFSWWLDEAEGKGYIAHWDYEVHSFDLSDKVTNTYTKQLKTKMKIVTETILQPHIYTPDFIIEWTDKAKGVFFGVEKQNGYHFKLEDDYVSYVETKGSFDSNNMTRLFSLNQKWVYQKHGVYINLAKISNKKNSFFDKTFTPKRFLLTDKSGKPRALKYEPKTLESMQV